MSIETFKGLTQKGVLKRADAFKAPIDSIFVEDGFNLREEDEELEAHVNELTEYLMAGGTVPPLEVRPVEGGVIIVDGHCRFKAYKRLIERGVQIEYINVTPFRGNDADQIFRVITSARGKALTPIETARGYLRLRNLGLNPADIAKGVQKSRTHVDQMLLLATGNVDVQQMVNAGQVSASIAAETIRKQGPFAGRHLKDKLETAKANGKKKVTAKTLNPKKEKLNALLYSLALLDVQYAVLENVVKDAKILKLIKRTLDAYETYTG